MVNFVLIFFSLLSLLSCAHAPLIKDSDWFKTESGQNFDIKLQCELFNDKLESIQSWPGSFCSFRDNGELYLALKDFIRYIDSDSNIRWTKKINVHHKLKISKLNGEDALFISSHYRLNKDKKSIRIDKLNVMNPQGEIIKSYDFEDYLKKNKNLEKSFWKNQWSTDGHEDKSLEQTHVNSFSEIFQEDKKSGKQELTGYLAYCVKLRKVFIFDKDLKKIKQTIDFGERHAHDVQMYGENKLVYFLNYIENDPTVTRSRIEIYDMNTKSFSILHDNPEVGGIFSGCGSVQQLSQSQLMVAYSNCVDGENAKRPSYIEFVNLKNGTAYLRALDTLTIKQSAELVDPKDIKIWTERHL